MLSPRQHDTYTFIVDYLARHQQAPTLDEIAAGLGIRSKGVAHRYLQALAAEGVIRLLPGRHRGIELVGDSEEATSLPLLGRIAAGRPIEAIPDQQSLDLSQFFTGPNRFVLKVQGDSMVEAGILDGDMVIIERRERAAEGTIVVALVDREEATLKRIHYPGDGSVVLIPENRAMAPMRYAAERVAIQGVLVGQMRSYV